MPDQEFTRSHAPHRLLAETTPRAPVPSESSEVEKPNWPNGRARTRCDLARFSVDAADSLPAERVLENRYDLRVRRHDRGMVLRLRKLGRDDGTFIA